TSNPLGDHYNAVLTDGANVVYRQFFIGYGGNTFLYTGTSTLTLVDNSVCMKLDLSFAVNGGWTADAAPHGTCATLQVGTRAPDDTRAQVSVWNSDSTAEAVNDSGEVMLWNAGQRYRATAGDTPDQISSTLGRAVWLDGQWYIVMGRTLFSIGSPPPDGG